MPRYKITTLVDITRTQATRSDKKEQSYYQQINFNSLIQTIGMRSNIDWQNDPVKHHGRLPLPWDGRASYWIWEFDVEREQVFEKDGDPVSLLKEDLTGVPIVTGLEESINVNPPVFLTAGKDQNTLIEII